MSNILSLLALVLVTTIAHSQKKVGKEGILLNRCDGAINIFENGDFHLQFTGKKSDSDVDAYPSLERVGSDNLLWLCYIATEDGKLTFTGSLEEGFLKMIVFEEMSGDICGEIQQGTAEIKRMYIGEEQSTVGLNYEVTGGTLYTLELRKGEKIQVVFATHANSKEMLSLHWNFQKKIVDTTEEKVVDHRDDDFAPTFRIIVKDAETNLPLIANISLEGDKEIAGLYVASELLFNLQRNIQLLIKCDVEGYFFDDRLGEFSSFEDEEITILLEKVASGKSLQIEEIEFVPGTSEITKSSEPKLRRLKDFLALNATLEVEIQGHVFALGDNSFAGQRISEARARRVMKYLVDNGIDKDRLTAVGYGNTRPVYREPQFSYEEQANRRVEIVVK